MRPYPSNVVGWILILIVSLASQTGADEILLIGSPPSSAPPVQLNGNSFAVAVSEDGNKILFKTGASNLAPEDQNGPAPDLFLYNRTNQAVQLVSVALNGTNTPLEGVVNATMTLDGRWVVFESDSPDLFAGKTNRIRAIYMRDMVDEKTTLVSTATNLFSRNPSPNALSENAQITPDGRFVLYESAAFNLILNDKNSGKDLFVRDLQINATLLAHATPTKPEATPLINLHHNSSFNASISDDGRFVLFESGATNLVVNDINGDSDIFLRDMVLKTNYLLSHAYHQTSSAISPLNLRNGSTRPVMNAEATKVAFASSATNLTSYSYLGTGIFIRNLTTGRTIQLLRPDSKAPTMEPTFTMNREGRFVAYTHNSQVYLWDDQLLTNHLVSSEGTAAGLPVFSRDGKTLAFQGATLTNSTLLVEPGLELNIQSVPSLSTPILSANGAVVIFDTSTSLTAEDRNKFYDVYVYNIASGTIELISRPPEGPARSGNAGSRLRKTGVSRDGSKIVFNTRANDLVTEDTNSLSDIFLRETKTGLLRLISRAHDGAGASSGSSVDAAISWEGDFVVFLSSSSNLVANFEWSHISPYRPYRYNLYGFDVPQNKVTLISTNQSGQAAGVANKPPLLSRNGRFILFFSASPETGNSGIKTETLYIYDRLAAGAQALASGNNVASIHVSDKGEVIFTRGNQLILKPSSGATEIILGQNSGMPAVAADGRYLLGFESLNPNTLYFYDTEAGTRRRIAATTSSAKSTNETWKVSLTEDGQYGAFVDVTPLPAFRQVFLVQTSSGADQWPGSVDNFGSFRQAHSDSPMLSSDGRYLLFRHAGGMGGENMAAPQIYLRDRYFSTTKLLSQNSDSGFSADSYSFAPFFAPDGSRVFFHSVSTRLVPGDANIEADIFYMDIANSDTDGDKLDDAWEMTFFESLEQSGSSDADDDGLSNMDEFLAGSDPTGTDDVLAVAVVYSLQGETSISFNARGGTYYQIQFKDDLTGPWINLGKPFHVPSTRPVAKLDRSEAPHRFYRAVLLP